VKDKEVSVHPVRRRSDSRTLAAQLAPLEELRESQEPAGINGSQLVAQENGAIVVGVEQLELAKEVVEVEEQKRTLGLEPVVIVIVGLMLAFIMFIAWQISQMPRN
jgi:uncharacterized membrane protein YqjE